MTFLPRAAFTAFCTICLAVSPCFANQSTADFDHEADQLFAAYDRPGSPGCALGVVHNGEFVYKKGYGLGNLELGVPLAPQSVFYMGSISKQFTAASIVLAAEQGYLSLDDDIRKYVPEIPSYGKTITLREMLHHTSGLRDILALLALSGRNAEDIHTTAELLDLLSRQKSLNFTPGDEYSYSNSNYFLLGIVVGRATGKPLSVFADENIFRPLGMSHTLFYDDHTLVVPGRVAAYEPRDNKSFRVDWSTNFDKVGDGGLMSSVDDLLLWDRNFYDNKLGKGTLLKELQTRGVLNSGKQIEYALGLDISSYRGLPTVEHGGALFGYRTEILRFPEQKFSVLCLCNLGTSDPGRLSEEIADIYLASQFPPNNAGATTLHVDPQPFVGLYRNAESHAVVMISATGSDLVLFGQHLKAVSSNRFSMSEGPELLFQAQANGAMRLTVTDPDSPASVLERFEPIKPSVAELNQFTGEYVSDELQTTYQFAVKDGKLTMTAGWQQPMVLEPTVQDEFQVSSPFGGLSFVFQRDAAGHISALDVFAGRVRDISFERKSK